MRRIRVLSVLLVPSLAGALPQATFEGWAQSRFAEHMFAPITPASERIDINGVQKLKITRDLNFAAGGRFWYENIYFTQRDRYDGAVRERDSREVRLQDLYLDYRNGSWSIRLGNQQVVWGETFGNPLVDTVNPRDLREGTPLDNGDARRSTAMANLRYTGSAFAVQALILPVAEFHVMPQPGSDFAPIQASRFGFDRVQVDREMRSTKGGAEFGGRFSTTLGKTDLSLLYLNHMDRFPVYELASDTIPGQTLHLRERHRRLQTFGGTLAADIDGYVLRVETINRLARWIPIIDPYGQFTEQQTDELSGTVELDFPTWRSVNFSAQIANSSLSKGNSYVLRKRNETSLGARALVNVFRSATLEALVSRSLTDRGFRVQSELMAPLASNLELRSGVDLLGGPTESQMGGIRGASRVYVTLKAYWGGFKEPAKPRKRARSAR